VEQYRRMGFNVQAGGVHPGMGTHNAIALNEDDYIELVAIRDPAETPAAGSWAAGLAGFIAAGGGIRYVILQSDDLAADVAAMRGRGVDVSDVTEGSRRTPGGEVNRWKAAFLGPKNDLPLFFIEHLTSMDERRRRLTGSSPSVVSHQSSRTTDSSSSVISDQSSRTTDSSSSVISDQSSRINNPRVNNHPNGVVSLERTYIVTHDVRAEAPKYAKVLGMPQPPLQKGTVIMSDMAVFQLGPNGLGIVQPYAPGVAADALERCGPGPFQALYRTASMGAAARWMHERGMPPLARGVRNTGEQAMLVPPGEACGAYIGFVGPE
jgi:hypothetical protein